MKYAIIIAVILVLLYLYYRSASATPTKAVASGSATGYGSASVSSASPSPRPKSFVGALALDAGAVLGGTSVPQVTVNTATPGTTGTAQAISLIPGKTQTAPPPLVATGIQTTGMTPIIVLPGSRI